MLPLAPPLAANTLILDNSSSTIEVAIKTTIGNFISKFDTFTPQLYLDPSLGKVTGSVHFLLAELKSNNDERDMEIYTWLKTDKFPKADFVLDKVTTDFKTGASEAQGRLTIQNVERIVNFSLSVAIKNKVITIEGSSDLDTRDYGLPIYRKFYFFSAEPKVRVHFRLIGSVSSQ
jgi:polyisoprenoid-binding protein YceI